jgi:hypothetical protein
MQNMCKVSICDKNKNNIEFTDTYKKYSPGLLGQYEKFLPIY